MPQFDIFSFVVQVFWLTFFSLSFYIFFLKYPIKSTTEVLKVRDILSINFTIKKIDGLYDYCKFLQKNRVNINK